MGPARRRCSSGSDPSRPPYSDRQTELVEMSLAGGRRSWLGVDIAANAAVLNAEII